MLLSFRPVPARGFMEELSPESGVVVVPASRWRGMARFVCAIGISLAVMGVARAADLSAASQNLFDAIQRNDLAAAQISIADGADLSARNSFGMLPVDLAVEKGHFEIAHYLLSLRQMEQSAGDDTKAKPAEDSVASPAQARPPVQSAPLSSQPLKPPPAQTPPAPPSSPAAQPGGGAVDPFDPMAVPDAARHPVITGSGPENPDGGVAEPPPPPAVPEDAHSRAAPSLRPEPASPEVSELPPPAKPNPDLLNRIGDMLGLDEQAGSEASSPPPPVPPAAEPASVEPEQPVQQDAKVEAGGKPKESEPQAKVVKEPEKPKAAAKQAQAPVPPKKPEPPAAAIETAQEPSDATEADLEVEDSLEADLGDGNFKIPKMAEAPPPPPLLTPPLLDSEGKSAFVTQQPEPAPVAAETPVEPAPTGETGGSGEAGLSDIAPDRQAEQQAALPDESALGEEPAEPAAAAKTPEPQAPASAPVTAAPEEGKKPTMLARVTEDFDETYENFLGGWFFRWMGQKMGISEPKNEIEENAQRSPKAGAAVAISELAPRRSRQRESEPARDIAPPPADAATEVPSSPQTPEEPAPRSEAPAADLPADAVVPSEVTADNTGPDVLADTTTDQVAALPDTPVEASPSEPTEQTASGIDAPLGLTDGLRIVATAPKATATETASRPGFEVPPGLTDGLRIVTSAPGPASSPAVPAPEPEPTLALGGLDLPEEPKTAASAPAPSATGGGDVTEIGDLDTLPDAAPDAVADAAPAAIPVADALGAGLEDLASDTAKSPAPKVTREEDQLAEIGDLGLEEEALNPVRAASDDAFAPTAVPPGSTHPVIGDKAPEPPKPVPSVSDLDLGDSLAALPDSKESSGLGELDSLASDLGAEAPANTGKGNGNGSDSLMSKLSQFLEADDPLSKNDKGSKPATSDDGLSELAALAKDVGVVRTAPVKTPVAQTLPETVLTLGESVHLTSAMPPKPDDPAETNYCVEKQRNNIVFCVEPVDWPPDLVEKLRVSTIMYQGAQAVVRYDEGQATRFHAIFPTSGFEPLVAYYARRFGPPSEIESRKIAPFGRPRQENPVYVWRRDDPLSGKKTTLEVRQFDDGRGGFPDLRHGAVMLYNDASKPIFPVLSALDLMPTTGTN